MEKDCNNCRYDKLEIFRDPCYECGTGGRDVFSEWERKGNCNTCQCQDDLCSYKRTGTDVCKDWTDSLGASKSQQTSEPKVIINLLSTNKEKDGKLRYDLVEPVMIKAIVLAFMSGLEKGYKEGSWQDVENFEPDYSAALLRHHYAYQEGETHASDTGIHHRAAELWNAAVLLWYAIVRKKEPLKIDV